MKDNCPACGNEVAPALYYSSEEWEVIRCPKCTFAWVKDISNRPETAFGWGEDIVSESGKRAKLYEDRLRRVEKYQPVPKSWLDVGCGGGGFLKVAAAAGYEVQGVEPSPAAEIASAQYNIPVYKSDLTTMLSELSTAEYGVISYFHVLEHVFDPLAELQVARQLLNEKSLLVIEVPFFDTFSWKIFGSRHRHFYRGHRHYFNETSMRALLSRAGFSVLELGRAPYYMTVDWLMMRLGGISKKTRPFTPDFLLNQVVRMDLGDLLLVIAKKD